SRIHRADGARAARPRQAGRSRLQAAPDARPRRAVRCPGAGEPQAGKPMTAVDYLLPILFVITLFLNIRASFKLGLDWRGMLTTVRFVRQASARLAVPGPGRKAHQLNWTLRPEALRELLGEAYDPTRVFVGVSDADSIPDPDTYRWIASRELDGEGSLAYQGITLSLGNYDRLDIR